MNLATLHEARRVAEKVDAGGIVWGPVRILLLICSWFYGAAVIIRRFFYAHIPGMTKRVEARVVSIGNITVGGAGKTPIAETCARLWLEKQRKVAIVSRGYGKTGGVVEQETHRPPEGVRVVGDGDGRILLSPEESGDEPYLLATRVPGAVVLVSGDRVAACEFAVKHFGAEVIILDDGFQHVRIQRDEDIVVIDATNPFGNGHLLPRGTLREPVAVLRRASRILITKLPLDRNSADTAFADLQAKLHAIAPNVPVSRTRYVPTHLSTLDRDEKPPLSSLKGRKVVAFSGIANPGFFEHTLNYLGATVVHARRYPDHHRYTADDMASIENDAEEYDADCVVTTEKDMVRLPRDVATKCRVYAIAVEVGIDDE